jgi:hypothetical protein
MLWLPILKSQRRRDNIIATLDKIGTCFRAAPPSLFGLIGCVAEREHNELTNTILDEVCWPSPCHSHQSCLHQVPEEIVRMLEEEKKRVSSLTKTVELQKHQLAAVGLSLCASAVFNRSSFEHAGAEADSAAKARPGHRKAQNR